MPQKTFHQWDATEVAQVFALQLVTEIAKALALIAVVEAVKGGALKDVQMDAHLVRVNAQSLVHPLAKTLVLAIVHRAVPVPALLNVKHPALSAAEEAVEIAAREIVKENVMARAQEDAVMDVPVAALVEVFFFPIKG